MTDISQAARGFDVWFDNIFSDLSVRTRIVEAHEQVKRLWAHVRGILAGLQSEHSAVAAQITGLDAERERLLVG